MAKVIDLDLEPQTCIIEPGEQQTLRWFLERVWKPMGMTFDAGANREYTELGIRDIRIGERAQKRIFMDPNIVTAFRWSLDTVQPGESFELDLLNASPGRRIIICTPNGKALVFEEEKEREC